ncbi:MAG: phosphate regulon transcriptional regulator PhoB [Methylophilaceae bacterium]|nr:phosphate regulon transcriptional regulator PhoB [Methylophilaceae bacterium]
MPARILIVEDELAIQELIALHVSAAGYQALLATSVGEAEMLLDATLPNLIILDWMLPDVSGISFLRQLKTAARTCAIPVMMLTARCEEYDKVRGLDIGADDYMTKPFSPRELNARIRAILRRHSSQENSSQENTLLLKQGLILEPSSHRVSYRGQPIHLSPTEFKLLHFLMENPERVHSRDQLLDNVWGNTMFVSDRTVDVQIRRLRRVLSSHQCSHLVQTVRGAGYRFSSQD